MKQLQTGVPGLDEILDGGIPEKKVIMLTGYAGTGKTIFSTQFLIGGIKNQETAVYVTFEETAQEIIDNTMKFGWNLESLIEENGFRVAFRDDSSHSAVYGLYVSQ